METLEQLRLRLKRWHRSGYSWRAIGKKIGRSGGWTWFVAHGQITPDDEYTEEIMRKLPRHLWQTTEELEASVLAEIQNNHVGLQNAIQMRLLGKIVGVDERKARAAVEALRKKGYVICTSIGMPAGAFWPANPKDFWEFIHRNYRPRWTSMKSTEDAMIQGYARWFPAQNNNAILIEEGIEQFQLMI